MKYHEQKLYGADNLFDDKKDKHFSHNNNNDFGNEYNDQVITEFDPKNNTMDYDMFRLRTDTEPLIDKFRMFLRQSEIKTTIIKGKDGREQKVMQEVSIKDTKRIMNEIGVNRLTMLVRNMVNNHIVQASTDQELLRRHMLFISTTLARDIMVARQEWELSISNYHLVLCNAVEMIFFFLTRTGEKMGSERGAYGQAFTTRETYIPQQQNNKNNGFLNNLINWRK